jgi:hypothetical protein
MTSALKDYYLTKLDLFTPNPLFPSHCFPRLRFALYDCVGVETTMFMRDEVVARAKLIHGGDDEAAQKARKKRRAKVESATPMRVVHGQWMRSIMAMHGSVSDPSKSVVDLKMDGKEKLEKLVRQEWARDGLAWREQV